MSVSQNSNIIKSVEVTELGISQSRGEKFLYTCRTFCGGSYIFHSLTLSGLFPKIGDDINPFINASEAYEKRMEEEFQLIKESTIDMQNSLNSLDNDVIIHQFEPVNSYYQFCILLTDYAHSIEEKDNFKRFHDLNIESNRLKFQSLYQAELDTRTKLLEFALSRLN